ncbi:hypothetical protein CGLAU_04980 [Corynebacterium glaucum]|uniref:Substrate binding domain of ABC-type glycine betaine transport system n=1 Tax=Corynebacterium glaucum TaxID=187491 RepID=A0A1Q2HW10_9CORY|nr:hypothetical protein [Corynebacterium glaucum]AQQ14970.1 hypothetical protein CGLAU_04980 [Corynebacterium glaucum]
MGVNPKRSIAGAAALAAASALLVGCSTADNALAAFSDTRPVSIGIDPDSAEQVVLGEIYSEIFNSMGYAVGVISLSDFAERDAVQLLRTQEVDLVISCTGTLLDAQDHAAARALAASGETGEALSVATYDAMQGTFPADIRTVDPSPAQGCGAGFSATQPATQPGTAPAAQPGTAPAGKPQLPQNIVPIFTDSKFDRRTVQRINFITRVMATEDIAEAAERVEGGEPVRAAVSEWLMEYANITIGLAPEN